MCIDCKSFTKSDFESFLKHVRRHRRRLRKRCHYCDAHIREDSLSAHIKQHFIKLQVPCGLCGEILKNEEALKKHLANYNSVKPKHAMPHVCEYCNKAFRFKQILKNHERQHTGAKPYSCQNCGMEFTNWSNYNKHMKRRHGTDTSKKKITPDGVFPINPETGQIVQLKDTGTEEWKSKIMIPAKRGKKKVIKEETSS
ncbi:unnamed protein product, partial [Iphiclides podalirius]